MYTCGRCPPDTVWRKQNGVMSCRWCAVETRWSTCGYCPPGTAGHREDQCPCGTERDPCNQCRDVTDTQGWQESRQSMYRLCRFLDWHLTLTFFVQKKRKYYCLNIQLSMSGQVLGIYNYCSTVLIPFDSVIQYVYPRYIMKHYPAKGVKTSIHALLYDSIRLLAV